MQPIAPPKNLKHKNFDLYSARCSLVNQDINAYKILEEPVGSQRPLRVIHIGAGASGVCAAKLIPDALKNIKFICYDKNEDIGGCWFENRYPGCACDVPSANYQFSWARKPDWTHFYPFAEEVHSYLKDVVQKFDLGKYIKLQHAVIGAEWDDEEGLWAVTIKNLTTSEVFTDSAEILINGGGSVNYWKMPKIEGQSDFLGQICHSANYCTSISLQGKRVAVLGAGSSGIQIVSTIANKVDKLYTWVRSPIWITPSWAQTTAGTDGGNIEFTAEQKKRWREDPREYVKYCKDIENELNQRFKIVLNGSPEALQAKKICTELMKQKLGNRQDLIDTIIPTEFGVGCRRPTPGYGYLEALTLPHVTTFTEEIRRITETGFVDKEGKEHEVDIIICATGFDTSWRPRFPVVANGKNVQDIQSTPDGPISYLSLGIPDIPNYFTVSGPYGPIGHGSFWPLIENLHKHFIQIIIKLQAENIKSITPKLTVCREFKQHADLYVKRTAWSSNCSSWFKQGSVDGPLAIWPGSRLHYLDVLKTPRYEDYDIIYRSANKFTYLGNGFSSKEFDGSDLSYYLGTEDDHEPLIPE